MNVRAGMVLAWLMVLGIGGWAWSQAELQFNEAQVAATFVKTAEDGSARDAIKAGLERFSGTLDIAVDDFTDLPLQFVLIRLSSERSIRLLIGRGGAFPEQESKLCEQLGELFEVRFAEGLGHRFAVVGGQDVVLSSAGWTSDALEGASQSIVEVESVALAQAFSAQFEALWEDASASCSESLQFP